MPEWSDCGGYHYVDFDGAVTSPDAYAEFFSCNARVTVRNAKAGCDVEVTGGSGQIVIEDTCAGGTLAFDWLHPRTTAPATFRFIDAPRVSASSAIWFLVALKIEEMP